MSLRPRLIAGFLVLNFFTLAFSQEIPPPRPVPLAPGREGLIPVALETNPLLRPTSQPATSSKKDKVTCQPSQPRSGEPVQITVFPNKSVQSAILEYQLVKPGQYITFQDKAYKNKWTSLPMTQSGDHFSATMPSELQVHRTLVRYRFRLDGAAVPQRKELAGNYAYFCFDGIGSWKGAIEPGSTDEKRAQVVEYDEKVMNSIQPFILITKKQDVEDCEWNLQDRTDRRWIGTLVYNGKVFDHIFYRTRGAGFRYALAKDMWKILFDKENPITLVDDYGTPWSVPVDNMDLSACMQERQYLGEQGMFEATNFRLFQLASVPSSKTTWLQLRVIDQPDEVGITQYDGDLWGLYLAVENPDSNFVKEHKLPRGNLFKMDRMLPHNADLKTRSPTLPSDYSDLDSFSKHLISAKSPSLLRTLLTGVAPADTPWLRDNIDLPKYYSYHALVECINHIDLGGERNCSYFHDPDTGRWYVIPWDTALTWNGTYKGGQDRFSMALLDRPEFCPEYHNRLREIRDLLFNPDEMSRLIDSLACVINTPGQPSFTDVDRAIWDYNPVGSDKRKTPRGAPGMFYKKSDTADFPGIVKYMKSYVADRAKLIDEDTLKADRVPETPMVQYIGEAGYPKKGLTFSCSAFQSEKNAAFSAIQWRIARVDVDDPAIKRPGRLWEIQPLWQSDELKEFTLMFKFPQVNLMPGATYRVRARIKDSDGLWSHWSDPVQWTLGSESR